MLDFSLTDEQEEARRLARRIAVEQLRPRARAAERGDADLEALWRTLAQTGLLTPFPEVYGGSGLLDAMTHVLIAEELGFGDAGLALSILGSLMGPLAVVLAGSVEQQQQAIPPFCEPQVGPARHGSLAFAEHMGGYACSDIQAQARLVDQHYLLNGTKRDVIHGHCAQLRVMLFRREDIPGPGGLCAAIFPDVRDGMQVSEEKRGPGLLAATSVSYTLNDFRLSEHDLLRESGNPGVLRVAALYLLLRAAVACGTVRAALEYASHYAEERIAFGRPIATYQSIAFLLAEMAMQLDAARLLLWRVALDWDRGQAHTSVLRDAEAVQRQALKLASSATTDAVQILGGAGFMQDHPVEMWMRNAATME